MESKLLDCGHEPSPHSDFTTGYGEDSNGRRFCYACCAEQDKAFMAEHGKITLYLSDNKVINWPGSLAFPVSYRKTGKHNMARVKRDVWFTGPDGKQWHGTQYGDNSDLCHCRRIAA